MNITEEVNNWCNICALFKSESCNECVKTAFGGMPNMWVAKTPTAIADTPTGKPDTPTILDSGSRRKFVTGAERDMQEGKGDMASVPWESILRLSKHYENGSKKYQRWNYRKGIPLSSFIDSACRHIAKYQCGCDDEDHLSAAAFNILGAMLMENTKPEMIDLPLREGKKTFNYFEDEER